MNSILYAVNIGTLATWLSVAGASTVGMFVSGRTQHLPELKHQELPEFVLTEGEFMDVELQAGGSAATSEIDSENNEETVHQQEAATPDVAEVTPEIPDIPEMADMEPLPEVPALPELKPEITKPSQDTFQVAKKPPSAPKASVKRAERVNPGTNGPVAKRTQSGSGTGSGAGDNGGSGAGKTGKDRMSGGRTPRPPYPAMAQKNGIEGVVRISITFGENGEVTDCSIVSASHPMLNNDSILSTIRKWKKPGMRGNQTLPIRFTLK